MELTDSNVNRIFVDCLYDDAEIAGLDRAAIMAKSTLVEGITLKVGFNPGKLEKYKNDIRSMLTELPSEFMHNEGGGGYTFLAACNDKHGRQWTDLHKTMDQLFMLGMAVKCVRYCLPRDFWRALPGGLPYYSISLDGFPAKQR